MYNETNFHDLMFREKYYKHNKNLHYMYIYAIAACIKES